MNRYRARRLPKQPGPAGWNALLAQPGPARRLDQDRSADITIIGGGFAGLAAGRRLVQLDPGLSVVVLEAGRIGEGPAGRNSGFMIDLPHDLASDDYAGSDDHKSTQWNRHAIAFARAAAEDYALDQETFDPMGKVNAAATERGHRHNLDYAAHLASMNEAYQMFDAAEMAEMTGSRHYMSGLFTPGTVMLQPAAYIRGFAAGLSGAIDIYEETPALAFSRSGGAWSVVTPTAKIETGQIILANNGHAASFGFFPRRLMHVFTYASMTDAFETGELAGSGKWGVTSADPMGTSVRRIRDGNYSRIVVRSRFTYNPGMEVSKRALAVAGTLHDRKLAERFPSLTGLKMTYRWAGQLCLSRNSVSVSGEVDRGVFAAICQNGLGTTKGTLAGMAAAEAALGQTTDLTRAMAAEPEPQRLPPEPIASIGANTYLRWKEFRAGVE